MLQWKTGQARNLHPQATAMKNNYTWFFCSYLQSNDLVEFLFWFFDDSISSKFKTASNMIQGLHPIAACWLIIVVVVLLQSTTHYLVYKKKHIEKKILLLSEYKIISLQLKKLWTQDWNTMMNSNHLVNDIPSWRTGDWHFEHLCGSNASN